MLPRKQLILLICGVLGVYIIYYRFTLIRPVTSRAKVNLGTLLEISIKAAEYGGREVVNAKNNLTIGSKGLTKEGLRDTITTADFRSHCVMTNILKDAAPNLYIVSEEHTNQCYEERYKYFFSNKDFEKQVQFNEFVNINDVTVWIDPLDATYEYAEKLYQYVTTMVCVAVNGKPVIGVIHKPFRNETYWAWVGKGKSPNLHTKESSRSTIKIIVSRSHSGPIKEVLDRNFKNYDLEEAAGSGFKVLQVAKGEADAYVHITAIKKWDICAPNAIIAALGGKMTTKNNGLISYRDIGDRINEDGIVATLKNHGLYVGKLSK